MSVSRCNDRKSRHRRMALLILLLALPGLAYAGGAGNADLPYEGAMEKLVASLTGPVAFGISVIGVVAAGAMLIFGGDMSGFMRSIVFLVLVIGLMVTAASVLSGLFGVSGGVIDAGAMLLDPLTYSGLA